MTTGWNSLWTMIDKLILVSLSAIIIPPVSPLRRWYCPAKNLACWQTASFSSVLDIPKRKKIVGLYKSVIGSRAGLLCEEKGSLLWRLAAFANCCGRFETVLGAFLKHSRAQRTRSGQIGPFCIENANYHSHKECTRRHNHQQVDSSNRPRGKKRLPIKLNQHYTKNLPF